MSELSTEKCAACGAILKPNNRVCAYCGILNNLNGEQSVENLSQRLEYILKLVREVKVPGFFSSSNTNSKIAMPILAFIAFMLAYKINGWFSILGFAFLVISVLSLFTKGKNIEKTLTPLKAQLDELSGKLDTLYGKDKKIKQLLNKNTNEWNSVVSAFRRRRSVEWISFAIIGVLLCLAFFLPEPKTASEIEKELAASETALTLTGDDLIKANNLTAAGKLLPKLKSAQNITELKSKIQLREIETKLTEIDLLISGGNTAKAASGLAELKWIKISSDYDLEQYEERFFKQFIEKKAKVNRRLPAEKKVKIEEEIDF